MKLFNTPVSQAVGAALLLASGAASAYVPTSNTDGAVTLYWGGATASSLSAQELTIAAVCVTNAHLAYVPTSATNRAPGNDWAVACETNSSKVAGLPASPNTRVLVVKRDRGGSGVGVGPVQTKAIDSNSGRITFLAVNGTNCVAGVDTPGTNGAPNILLGGTAVPLLTCGASYTFNAYAEIGTSDIEPDKFFGINTPDVDGTLIPFRSENDRAFAELNSLATLAFNIPASKPLRDDLQAIQFPASSVCHPSNAGYNSATSITTDRDDATNAESEACMPSLTRAEINSMLTGKILSWDQLDASLVDASADNGVKVCRRVNGSGSQATANALVGSFPCDPNLADGTSNIIQPLPHDGTYVIAGSGSSNVATCLDTFGDNNQYAIGILSVEGRNVDNSASYRFIKIDGVAPTLRNIHAGDYWFWAQQSCQRRNANLPYNVDAGRPSDTIQNKDRVFDALCGPAATNGLNGVPSLTKLNGPVNAANCKAGTNPGANCGSVYTWGQSGWLSTPTTSLIYDNVLTTALVSGLTTYPRPVNGYTREVALGRPNICQSAVKSDFGANGSRGTIVAPNPNWTP